MHSIQSHRKILSHESSSWDENIWKHMNKYKGNGGSYRMILVSFSITLIQNMILFVEETGDFLETWRKNKSFHFPCHGLRMFKTSICEGSKATTLLKAFICRAKCWTLMNIWQFTKDTLRDPNRFGILDLFFFGGDPNFLLFLGVGSTLQSNEWNWELF